MSDGYFLLSFMYSERKFYAIYIGESHFEIRELMAELHVVVFFLINMVVPYCALWGKHGLDVEDFYVKTIGRS